MSLSPDVIKQIRSLEFKARHLVTDALAGNYLSAFRGRGMEFDEVREYVPGDDIRLIDWNVTARMQVPFVKVHREERELTLMLMVDVSPSQNFGTKSRMKRELAAELAAVLAFLAIRNHDKVGLIVFSDHVEKFILPQKGRAHVWNIIRSVLTHQSTGATTDIASALTFMLKVVRKRAMAFLISDFWAQGYEAGLRMAARRHDLICARTADPLELGLASAGLVAFKDAESGATRFLDTSRKDVRELFSEISRERDEFLKRSCSKSGADYLTFLTEEPISQSLAKYFQSRQSRGTKGKRLSI